MRIATQNGEKYSVEWIEIIVRKYGERNKRELVEDMMQQCMINLCLISKKENEKN